MLQICFLKVSGLNLDQATAAKTDNSRGYLYSFQANDRTMHSNRPQPPPYKYLPTHDSRLYSPRLQLYNININLPKFGIGGTSFIRRVECDLLGCDAV
jgi:hypothetical protein